jgi:hypothetical protein
MFSIDGMLELLDGLKKACRVYKGYSAPPKRLNKNKEYFDTIYLINIKVGLGSWEFPQFIEGLTCQCKNCEMHQKRGHCQVTGEVHNTESWCSTCDPKMFFKPKGKE